MATIAPPILKRPVAREHREVRTPLNHYLPQVMVVTTVVAILPVALSWTLRAEGIISSPWL